MIDSDSPAKETRNSLLSSEMRTSEKKTDYSSHSLINFKEKNDKFAELELKLQNFGFSSEKSSIQTSMGHHGGSHHHGCISSDKCELLGQISQLKNQQDYSNDRIIELKNMLLESIHVSNSVLASVSLDVSEKTQQVEIGFSQKLEDYIAKENKMKKDINDKINDIEKSIKDIKYSCDNKINESMTEIKNFTLKEISKVQTEIREVDGRLKFIEIKYPIDIGNKLEREDLNQVKEEITKLISKEVEKITSSIGNIKSEYKLIFDEKDKKINTINDNMDTIYSKIENHKKEQTDSINKITEDIKAQFNQQITSMSVSVNSNMSSQLTSFSIEFTKELQFIIKKINESILSLQTLKEKCRKYDDQLEEIIKKLNRDSQLEIHDISQISDFHPKFVNPMISQTISVVSTPQISSSSHIIFSENFSNEYLRNQLNNSLKSSGEEEKISELKISCKLIDSGDSSN